MLNLYAHPCPGPGTGAPPDHRVTVHLEVTNDGTRTYGGTLQYPWRVLIKLTAGTYQIASPGHRVAQVQVAAHQMTSTTLAPDCS